MNINLFLFSISTYFSIILIAFIISFIFFYKKSKCKLEIIDVFCVYVTNIIGFAIGAKIFNLIEYNKKLNTENFINSGYGFCGGMIGSILLVFIYCKITKIDYTKTQSYLTIIYPLIYSVCKIGCYLNKCCTGIIFNIPVQIFESIIFLLLFVFLFIYSERKNNNFIIPLFLLLFGSLRILTDYFRDAHTTISLTQIICFIFIIISFIIFLKNLKPNKILNCINDESD